jgi:hypothetical protein
MKPLQEIKEFAGAHEAIVVLPYEGNPKQAVKEYGITILETKQDRWDRMDGITVTTFGGTRKALLSLLEEFGGEENAVETMDAPMGRIVSTK